MSANSVYGSDSIPEVNSPPIKHSKESVYSSTFNLSGITSQAETSKTLMDPSISEKTHAIREMWSEPNGMVHCDEFVLSSKEPTDAPQIILERDATPFIFDGSVIHYNIGRGVNYETPVLFGTRTLNSCDPGYRASHFIFDPKTSSLAVGYDPENTWCKLPKYSLLTGIGTTSELDASFVSGAYNAILTPPEVHAPACSILGGNDNFLRSSLASALIACSGVDLSMCQNTVMLGVSGATGMTGLQEATVVRNLYTLGTAHFGPLPNTGTSTGTVFDANGNGLVRGNLTVNGNTTSTSGTFSNLTVNSGTFNNLTVNMLQQHELYVVANNGVTATFVILPSNNYDIVYANPIGGPVNIYLGTGTNTAFPASWRITFKDVTLEFGTTSMNNVNILVPNPIRIEYYNCGLTAGTNAGYAINTIGGAVTFRYFSAGGVTPTWVIENQFIGNMRPQCVCVPCRK